jgi:hypothetical protein
MAADGRDKKPTQAALFWRSLAVTATLAKAPYPQPVLQTGDVGLHGGELAVAATSKRR